MICPESNTYGYAVLMKLRELSYANIYFSKEKDKFNALYGGGSIGKAGFSTQGASRAKILTKLEEMIRNDRVAVYSSRFVEEMKTFVWTGQKAQAQTGKNDDLVMSLAIGLWLYESESKVTKKGVDLNQAMLAAFAVNKQPERKELHPSYAQNMAQLARRGMPVSLDESHPAISGSIDFKWLL